MNGGIGGLQAVAIQRTVLLIDHHLAAIGRDVTIPGNDAGISP